MANASDAVIALPGKWGTSNELSFAMIAGIPVVAIEGWETNLRDDKGLPVHIQILGSSGRT